MTFKGLKAALAAGTLALGFVAANQIAEAKAAKCWVDGKAVKVKGKNAKAQEAACTEKGGVWSASAPKQAAAEPAAPTEPAAPPADAGGGGGGW